MEKQQIVVSSKYETLNGDIENIVSTNQYQQEIDNFQILKQKIVFRDVKMSVNEATFLLAVNNIDGQYQFKHIEASENWVLNGEIDVTDLADYGISLDKPAQGKDTMVVVVDDGKVTFTEYAEHTKLFENNDIEFGFVSFVASSEVTFYINDDTDRVVNLLKTKKVEIDCEPMTIDIDVFNTSRKDIETTLILAKKVEE